MAVLGRERIDGRVASQPQVAARLSRRLLALAVLLVGATALIPVLQTSSATERGGAIRSLEQQRTELLATLHEGEAEMAFLTSTARVRKEAIARLGMVPADRILYVTVDGTLPQQRLPERFVLPDATVVERSEDPWWRSIVDVLPLP